MGRITIDEFVKLDKEGRIHEIINAGLDAIEEAAHRIAMTKKGLLVSAQLTEEEVDSEITEIIDREWAKVKDMTSEGYFNMSLGELVRWTLPDLLDEICAVVKEKDDAEKTDQH